jgi:O-antigen/teichoic acid export membrane protein
VREIRSRHRHLLDGSAWLLLSAGITAASGFSFWLAAVHLNTAHSIGLASALFSSAIFVAYLTSVGLPITVARYANDEGEHSRVFFAWALVLTTFTSLLGVGVFLLVAPGRLVRPLNGGVAGGGRILFFLVVVGIAFTALVDMRWMALRRWRSVVLRNAIVAVGRFPLLAFPSLRTSPSGLFLIVGGSLAASGLVGAIGLLGRPAQLPRLLPLPDTTLSAARFSIVNYAGQLGIQAPIFALPVVVVFLVSATANAAFYVAWSIAIVVSLIPQVIAQVLLVEGSRDGIHLRGQVSIALGVSAGACIVATVGAAAFAQLVPGIYGHAYEQSAHLLPILVAGTIPWAITVVALSTVRVLEAARQTLVISLAFALAVLVPGALLTDLKGIGGAADAWLIGNVVAAAVAAACLWSKRSSL